MTNIKQNINRTQGQISCQKREFMHRARQSLLRQIEEKENNDAMNKDQEGKRRIYRSTLHYLIGLLLIFGCIIGCTSIYRTTSERQLQGLKEAAAIGSAALLTIPGPAEGFLRGVGPASARQGSLQHATGQTTQGTSFTWRTPINLHKGEPYTGNREDLHAVIRWLRLNRVQRRANEDVINRVGRMSPTDILTLTVTTDNIAPGQNKPITLILT